MKTSEGCFDHATAADVADALCYAAVDMEGPHGSQVRVTSFSKGGVLTENAGFTLRLADGREFQVTVVRSK